MTKTNRWLVYGVAVMAAVTAGVFGSVSLTHAETIIDIAPAVAQTGVQVSIGQCPCFRWTVQAKAGSGSIETQDILISTDALFRFTQTNSANFQELASRLYTAGAIEMLVKGGHVGVGFNGVTWGSDADRGYSNMLRTGFYVLANLIKNDSVTLNTHTGYNWDSFVSAINGMSGSRGLVDQAVSLNWVSGPWSGTASAHIGFQADSNFFNADRMVVGAAANVRARVVSFSDFELGLTAQVSAEHDGFRELLGLNPNNAIASLLFDLSWVERDHTN